ASATPSRRARAELGFEPLKLLALRASAGLWRSKEALIGKGGGGRVGKTIGVTGSCQAERFARGRRMSSEIGLPLAPAGGWANRRPRLRPLPSRPGSGAIHAQEKELRAWRAEPQVTELGLALLLLGGRGRLRCGRRGCHTSALGILAALLIPLHLGLLAVGLV